MLNYPCIPVGKARSGRRTVPRRARWTGRLRLPSLGLELMKSVASYETTRTFSAPTTTWPSERWWSGYGDAQLDALIEEALRDAPDMATASARLRRAEAIADRRFATVAANRGQRLSRETTKLQQSDAALGLA